MGGAQRIVRTSMLLLSLAGAVAGIDAGEQSVTTVGEATFDGLRFRNIGPAVMGGRIDDIAVDERNPAVFYVAAATSGLWKTTNNATTFTLLAVDRETSSIGDVTLAPSNPEVVWVGTGEPNNRQSSSWGNGVHKSTDGGRTWTAMGLRDSKHIARIVIDSRNADIVYVAATGHLWGPNAERGVFMTTDGGASWTKVLFVDDFTAATDLAIDPSDDNVLYAAMYQRQRTTWGYNGGGPNSGLFKSTDAGRTWSRLTSGLPAEPMGRIGIDVYRRNPSIVYAIIEAAQRGGVYRSDDAGATWQRLTDLNPRPMYYSKIRIDPNDDRRIYVLGNLLQFSDDGGRTYRSGGRLHTDFHALWIDPANSSHLITGNDGGFAISWDRGEQWDFVNTLDLAQFYHVSYDMETPYNVYGGLQDSAVWMGPSANRNPLGIPNGDWTILLRGDGTVTLVDPKNSRTVYAAVTNGNISRIDRISKERKIIRPQAAAGAPPLRWNWDAPIIMSPHDSNTLLMGAERVFRTRDRGDSWTAISPDLTARIDRDGLPIMGLTTPAIALSRHDGVGAYGTLTALAESPVRPGLLFAGADDGSVHVSTNDGGDWSNLTSRFPGLPRPTYVSRIEASRFDERRVYVTFDGHRQDDYQPYVYMTSDQGRTWRSVRANLPDGQVVRCLAEDLKNRDVLYVGTESGVFVSIDGGGHWTRLGAGLPTVPVYEITLHPRDNDMLLATHGRSIWILDDLTPIQQLADARRRGATLFDIRAATQRDMAPEWVLGQRPFWGKNPEPGALLTFYLDRPAKNVALAIRDAAGHVVRTVGSGDRGAPAGITRLSWDLRRAPAASGGDAALVAPGEYVVTLSVDGVEAPGRRVRVTRDPAAGALTSDPPQARLSR